MALARALDCQVEASVRMNTGKLAARILPLAVINGMLGFLVYLWPVSFASHVAKLMMITVIMASITIYSFRFNLLFQARLLLLVVIGYSAGLVKSIDVDAAFSPVEIDAQTLSVGLQMLGLTSMALLGAAVGLVLGDGNKQRVRGIQLPLTSARVLFVAAAVVVLLTGYLSAKSYGPSVFVSAYASGEGAGQLLGNLQSIGVIALVVCAVACSAFSNPRVQLALVALGVYYFVWGIFIRGGRLEVISGLFALWIALPAARGRVVQFRLHHGGFLLALVILMEIWGNVRSTLAGGAASGEAVVEGYLRLAESGIYHFGTISGIATTFSNVLHMISGGVVEHYYGSSYFDYILRSPPEFIYPNRPADLAWMFEAYGYSAIGGFFELAEAYLNFGALGCLIVPFLISYFIAFVYRRSLAGDMLWFFVFIAVLSVFFRGAWYQTFAFYKGVLTGVTMYLLARALLNATHTSMK